MTATAAQAETTQTAKPYLPLERGWWRTPLLFMLSLDLVGLELWPALAISILFLAHAWRHDRYDFMIMLTYFFGGFGLYVVSFLPVWIADIVLLASFMLWFVYRKPPILKKTLVALCAMAIFTLVISFLSVESLSIQILTMHRYWYIFCIIVPFAIFSGIEFNFDTFIRRLFPYMLLTAIFYILDSFVICGHILIAKDSLNNNSTFYDPAFHPFSGNFYRIYPAGIFLYILVFIPIIRNYRLHWWQWALFAGSFAASQTFTVLIAFVAVFIFLQGSLRKILTWGVMVLVLLPIMYFIDGLLPTQIKGDAIQSGLRIKSSIDQFLLIYNAVDAEDIAEFGSGRMAQVIPKVEIVEREHRELIGRGFLHPNRTTLNQYIIDNEYYTDIEKAEEVTAFTEISQVNIYLHMGILGLVVITGIYLYLYYLIRKLKYAYLYFSNLVFSFFCGFGGYSLLNMPDGAILLAISFAIPILAERDKLGFNCPWLKRRGRRAELCQSLPHTDGAYGRSAQALR